MYFFGPTHLFQTPTCAFRGVVGRKLWYEVLAARPKHYQVLKRLEYLVEARFPVNRKVDAKEYERLMLIAQHFQAGEQLGSEETRFVRVQPLKSYV